MLYSIAILFSLIYFCGTLYLLILCKFKPFAFAVICMLILIVLLSVHTSMTGYSALVWQHEEHFTIFVKGAFEEFFKVLSVIIVTKVFRLRFRDLLLTTASFILILSLYENIQLFGFLYVASFSDILGLIDIGFTNLISISEIVKEIGVSGFISVVFNQFSRVAVHFCLCILSLIFVIRREYFWASMPMLFHGIHNTSLSLIKAYSDSLSTVYVSQSIMSMLVIGAFVVILAKSKALRDFIETTKSQNLKVMA